MSVASNVWAWGRTDIRYPDGKLAIMVIDMNEGRYWGDCPMCGEERRLDHAVGWYCGPTKDEIGAVSTEYRSGTDEPAIVGGMCCCRGCHDKFYGAAA